MPSTIAQLAPTLTPRFIGRFSEEKGTTVRRPKAAEAKVAGIRKRRLQRERIVRDACRLVSRNANTFKSLPGLGESIGVALDQYDAILARSFLIRDGVRTRIAGSSTWIPVAASTLT